MKIPGIDRDHPLALAPMDEISDGPFRRIARRFGADWVVTGLVSAEGILHGGRKTLRKLAISADERPVAVQLVSSRIDSIVAAARRAELAGPDWIDLNFGCPVRKVAGKGGGAGLLREPQRLEEMARAVVRAVALPVSAKIRIGWDEGSLNAIEVAQRLEDAGVMAIAVHARARSQNYARPADWSWIARVKNAVRIPVIGNGDVREPADAARMFHETRCDGVMIGRAALGNPWIFRRARAYLESGEAGSLPTLAERFTVLREHLDLAAAVEDERIAVVKTRKHFGGYLRGTPGAARLRATLMGCETIRDVHAALERARAETG